MKSFLYLLILLTYSQVLKAQYEQPVFMNPGDDLQAIVDANPSGTLYILKEGIHRMQKINPKKEDIIIGEPGAIMNGSMILDNWMQEGNFWTTTLDPAIALTSYGTQPCEVSYPDGIDHGGCKLYQSLYKDGKPLWHEATMSGLNNLPDTIGSSAPIVVEPFYGDWYYDTLTLKIYLGFDPNGHIIETTVNQVGADYAIHSLAGGADDVLIKGLRIEKYLSTWGALTCADSDNEIFWEIENNLIQHNHSAGLIFSGDDNVLLRSNRIIENARTGIVGRAQSTSDGVYTLIDNNELAHNNYARFSRSWDAGATKFIVSDGIVLRNNHSHHNYGPGLWSDAYNYNFIYEGNLVENNKGVGIFHEISFDAEIRCNQVINNFSPGVTSIGTPDFLQSVYISNSSNVLVTNNYIRLDTAGRAIIALQAVRDTLNPFCTDNIDVIDNDIVYSFQTPIHVAGSRINPASLDSCGIPSHHFYDYNRYHHYKNNVPAKIYAHFDTLTGEGGVRSFAEWQADGHDINGSIDDVIINPPVYPACADIPKQMLIKAKLLLACLVEEGQTEMTLPAPQDRVHFQPFSTAPWNYQGKDVCPKFYNDMIDWVLLEIRDAANPDNILQQKAAILLKDGSIVDAYPSLRGVAEPGDQLDGVVIYDLIPNQNYLLSIQTRQQTMAMGNTSVLLPNATSYDFTNPNNVANNSDFVPINSTLIALNQQEDCQNQQVTCDDFDLSIDHPISGKIYHAKNNIVFKDTILPDSILFFKAGNSITFQAGFHAQLGSELTAQIEDCITIDNLVATPLEERSTPSSKVLEKTIFNIYPNPFQQQTSIELVLPKSQSVSLGIYDLSGRLIQEFERNSLLPAGSYQHTFLPKNLKAGMYLVRLQTDERVHLRKLIFVE